jgi:two-component system phosphate regulon response regulator PhoB
MARILVVDDEIDVVRMVVRTLEARGHVVEVARDGEAALARVAASTPDLVVLDLNLPRVDGIEVCRQIKSKPATHHIPVVMMSAAYVSLNDAEVSGGLGADEFVMKPFVRETLIRNVERLLKPRGP